MGGINNARQTSNMFPTSNVWVSHFGWVVWEGVGEYVFVREPGGIRLTLCELYMNISPWLGVECVGCLGGSCVCARFRWSQVNTVRTLHEHLLYWVWSVCAHGSVCGWGVGGSMCIWQAWGDKSTCRFYLDWVCQVSVSVWQADGVR